MTRLAYTVLASFQDVSTAEAFVTWLKGGHMDAVRAGGAESATLVRLDSESPAPATSRSSASGRDARGGAGEAGDLPAAARIEVRYIFPSRAVFERYLAVHAPALRAEGLAKFGPAQGVSMSRSIGDVL